MSDLATRLRSAIEDYGEDRIDDIDASYGRYPGSGASSRMRHEIDPLLAKVAELETALRELVRAVPSCHYCGDRTGSRLRPPQSSNHLGDQMKNMWKFVQRPCDPDAPDVLALPLTRQATAYLIARLAEQLQNSEEEIVYMSLWGEMVQLDAEKGRP